MSNFEWRNGGMEWATTSKIYWLDHEPSRPCWRTGPCVSTRSYRSYLHPVCKHDNDYFLFSFIINLAFNLYVAHVNGNNLPRVKGDPPLYWPPTLGLHTHKPETSKLHAQPSAIISRFIQNMSVKKWLGLSSRVVVETKVCLFRVITRTTNFVLLFITWRCIFRAVELRRRSLKVTMCHLKSKGLTKMLRILRN